MISGTLSSEYLDYGKTIYHGIKIQKKNTGDNFIFLI